MRQGGANLCGTKETSPSGGGTGRSPRAIHKGGRWPGLWEAGGGAGGRGGPDAHLMSKRSASITLVQAAAKSFTNFS